MEESEMICRWKGRRHDGEIACGRPLMGAEITTDNSLVTCKECKIILGSKISKEKHIHLNLNFIRHASLNKDEILEFKPFTDKIVSTVCVHDPRKITLRNITNDPREITCSHCKNGTWGKKINKKFILTGLMIEGGHDMRKIRGRLNSASNEKLKKVLNKLLYGDKV